VTGDRSAALLIRVWLEDRNEFRARLIAVATGQIDAAGEETTIAISSSPSDVLRTVSEWLDRFLGDATDAIDGR
jgi:hypothetical protein